MQALATQELFESYGLDVSIINYEKLESRTVNFLRFWAGKNTINLIFLLHVVTTHSFKYANVP